MDRRVLFVVFGLVFCAGVASAQTGSQPVIGARPAAMGESFVAVADDGNAAYWNPAGLPSLSNHEIQSMVTNLFGAGITNSYLSYTIPFTDRFAAGLDWLRLDFGDEELSFGQNRFALSTGYRLTDWLSLGANLKLLTLHAGLEGLASPEGFSSTGSGLGCDIGLLVRPLSGIKLGVMAQDVGDTRIEYENGVSQTIDPMRLRLGASYQLHQQVLLTGSVDEAAHVGAEYRLHPVMALRGGIERDIDDAIGMTYAVGTGLRYGFAQVDYAYTVSAGLGGTHRFSLGLAFNLSASAIKIHEVDLQPLFPAYQKRYSREPIGRAKFTNTGRRPLSATVRFFIPGAMERPTELTESVVIPPGTETVDLFALLGSRVSEWGRNRIVPAEIQVSYTEGSRTRTSRKREQVTIYRRNAMRWWDIGAAAAFVTPEDEVVASFASQALLSHDEEIKAGARAIRPLLRAMLLFDALGQYGIRYLPDPNTAYEQIAGKDFIVDSIQYPVELLRKRTGDCDDCTVLYCSLLENVGIPTALIDAPKHILMAFDTGVTSDDAQKIGLIEDQYLVKDGKVWIPVEVTLFGKSFSDARNMAVEECLRLQSQGQLRIVNTGEAWKTYPPAPPQFDLVIAAPKKADMASAVETDWQILQDTQETFLQRNYLIALAVDSTNVELRGALIYNLAQLGQYDRALAHLDILETSGTPRAKGENDRAIIYLMKGDLQKAEEHLHQALQEDPDDEQVHANLDYVLSKMGRAPTTSQQIAEEEQKGAKTEGEKAEAIEIRLEDLHWKH